MASGPNGCLGARAPILVEQDGRSDPVHVITLHHFWEDKLVMGLATLLILVQFLYVPSMAAGRIGWAGPHVRDHPETVCKLGVDPAPIPILLMAERTAMDHPSK